MAERTVAVRLLALTSGYQAALAKASASTRALGTSMAQTEITSQGLNKTLGNMGFSTKVGMAAAAGGIYLLGRSLMSTVSAAIDFESSFAGIRKTVDGTEADFEEIAEGMRGLAREIPVNVNELNRIGEAAGQLGISKEGIVDFTETIAKLGVTTNMVSDQAATELARFANITQMPEENFENLGSTIVALGNSLASTESEISEFGLRIAGAGELAGLTESEILAIGGAMSSVGIEAEAGGTAVQKVLLGISDSVHTADDRLAGFAETAGMSASQFQSAWQADPAQAFTAFVEGLGSAGKDANGILKSLNLTDQRLIRSFLTLAGAGDTLRESISLGNTAWAENSALTTEAEKRFETTASKIQLAQNQIEDFKITMGESTAVGLGEWVQGFTDAMLANDRMMESLESSFGLMRTWADSVDNGSMSMTEFIEKSRGLLESGDYNIGTLREMETVMDALEAAFADGATISEAFDQVLGETAGSTSELTQEQKDAGMTINETTGEIEEQITALDRLKGASGILGVQDAFLSLKEAQNGLKESQRNLNRLVENGKKGSKEYREALHSNREASLGALKAELSLAEAVEGLKEKVESGEVSMKDAVSIIKSFGNNSNVSKDYVQGLIDKVKGLTSGLSRLPEDKKTHVDVELSEAQNALQLWKNQLEQIPTILTTTVRVTQVGGGGAYVNHSGGTAGSGPRRVSGGLKSDEIPTILQRGELVISKAQMRERPVAVPQIQVGGAGDTGPTLIELGVDGVILTKTVRLHEGTNKVLLPGRS